MPEEVTDALGVDPASNFVAFDKLIEHLTSQRVPPTRVKRLMARREAELAFNGALRKETFLHKSLYSFHLNGGWLEFVLEFDDLDRLRRIYLQHKDIMPFEGIEIPLS